MAGVCLFNFTVGMRSKKPDVTNDGQHRLKGIFGQHFDNLYGYKDER